MSREGEEMEEVISAYSRKQAIEDGVLRDVSKLAEEAGFRIPVAVTAAVWAKYVAVPDACPWQDETGRLWDILTMLMHEIRVGPGGRICHFKVLVQNDEHGPKAVKLKAECGPGDDLKPVVTVMLVDED